MNNRNEQIQILKNNVSKKLNELLNPPANQVKKPQNRLWIALLAFNAIFLPLDVITGITIGYITVWYYGFFVFGAGFATMVVHEALYANAYAKNWQKVISVAGFLASVIVTALVGLTAIVTNIMFTDYNREIFGAGMAGFSFLVLFLHGILIAAYYFVDAGILAKQKTASSIADHETILQQFAFSEQMVDKMNELEKKLNQRIDQGDGERLGAALTNISGQNWIDKAGVRLNSDVSQVLLKDDKKENF